MVLLELHPGKVARPSRWERSLSGLVHPNGQPIIGGGGSIGNAVELKILDHLVANATYAAPSPTLGLWTSAVDDTSTAATAGEANYTGYARVAIGSSNMSPAAAGAVTNDVAITFGACTAGDDTVTHWMLTSSASGAGDNIAWGTCTSTLIDTTHTPPTVAIGGLDITLD